MIIFGKREAIYKRKTALSTRIVFTYDDVNT